MNATFQRTYLPPLAVGLASIYLIERLFLLVDRYAVNIFFSDQWQFNNATVFEKHTWWQIFTWQHGPHRQGAGGVLAKLLEPHFSWNSRTESFFIAGILVVTMLLALLLKVRLSGSLDYYDVAIPLLCLTATQCEVIFGAANLAHGSVPVLLVMLYCLAWTLKRDFLRYPLVAILNFLLIFTGFGFFIGLITPFALFWSYRISSRTRSSRIWHGCTMVAALASVALFFVHYRWEPAVPCYGNLVTHRTQYLEFVTLMYANFMGLFGVGLGPVFWGSILVLMLVSVICIQGWVLRRTNSMPPVVNVILIAYSLIFCAATARGRICLGLPAAEESRYMPYLIPGLLGVYFYLSSVTQRAVRQVALIAFTAFALYAGGPIHASDQVEMMGFYSGKSRWRDCYLANRDIAFCDQQTGAWIGPTLGDPHLQEKLDFLERNRLNFAGL